MSIICSHGHENPDGTFFCEKCGELVSMDSAAQIAIPVCHVCGHPNLPDAQLCIQCDAPLRASSSRPRRSTAIHNARKGTPRLIIVADEMVFEIKGTKEIIIGRADPLYDIVPDIDLTAHRGEDGGVSRIHARLRYEAGVYVLEDQKSTNHTYLNKQLLSPYTPVQLKHGDEIRLGQVLVRFEIAEE